MMDTDTIWQTVLTLSGSLAGVKVILNGMAKRVERIETKLDTVVQTHATDRAEMGERVAALEAKVN